MLLTLGLVTLWWGRDWAAWGLSLYGLSLVVNASLFMALPAPVGLAVRLINWTLIFPLVGIGLYVTALAVVGDTFAPAVKKTFHGIFTATLVARIILIDLPLIAFVVYGQRSFGRDIGTYIGLAVQIIPLAALALAYAPADSRRRSRIGWLFWAILLLVGINAWHLVTGIGSGSADAGWLLITVYWLAAIVAVAGLLYIALRRQVVALSFVINRAVVYSLTAGFIAGIFALLEVVLSNTDISRSAGLAVNVAVSLAIGLGLDTIHKRIETAIERLLFRRKYTAERTLREFAHQCAFMERPDRLLNEAAAQIHTQVQPSGVAIYDRVGDTYRCIRQRGDTLFPNEVDVDDHAFVAFRAGSKRIDLNGTDSALGGEGYAFPMAARGILQGALICGGRIISRLRSAGMHLWSGDSNALDRGPINANIYEEAKTQIEAMLRSDSAHDHRWCGSRTYADFAGTGIFRRLPTSKTSVRVARFNIFIDVPIAIAH